MKDNNNKIGYNLWSGSEYNNISSDLKARNNEIIIKATPKEVARGLMIQYQKEPRYLFFQPNSYAVSVYIYDASNKQIGMSATLSNDFGTLDLTTLPPGEYRVEFKCSGEPYVLTLVL